MCTRRRRRRRRHMFDYTQQQQQQHSETSKLRIYKYIAIRQINGVSVSARKNDTHSYIDEAADKDECGMTTQASQR